MYLVSYFNHHVWPVIRVYCTAVVSALFFFSALYLILVSAESKNPWLTLYAAPCVFLSIFYLFMTLVFLDRNEYEASISEDPHG